MKRNITLILCLALLCSSCGTMRTSTGIGSADATLTGAVVGGNVGSAIGGLIGEGNRGWRGGYRGSAIGTIIGTIAGAAIGNAVENARQEEQATGNYRQTEQRERFHTEYMNALQIRRIRFIDDNRDHVIQSGESSKIIFEIMNEGEQTARNVVPVVTETTGMKRIQISPSVMVERIEPHNGVKYTATLTAGERIKSGEINIRISVTDEYGTEYAWEEFSFPTER